MKPQNDLIHKIIEEESLLTMFQPLISMKRKSVLGYEALTRGLDPETGEIIPPDKLFGLCRDRETLLDLDRLCRKKALETFAPISKKNRSLLLSLNMDAAVLSDIVGKMGTTLKFAEKAGMPPGNIIIEIIESKAGDEKVLETFVSTSRCQGFLIALDDVGTGHSNLDRIPRLRPDIIKIDRSLIRSIENSFHNYEITGSLIRMAQKTGTLPLAEGVETIEEALTLMQMDVDVFQGFYFGKPCHRDRISAYDSTPILSAASRFKSHIVEKYAAEKLMRTQYEALAMKLRTSLEKCACDCEACQSTITEFIDSNKHIECAYILDDHGVQTTDTICNPYRLKERRRLIYNPAPKGADHSLKDYYLSLISGRKWHITRPYISLASGNRCLTVSTVFHNHEQRFVLCVDIAIDHK
ncbi:EAL domain-containing protein [Maridesulfovibrio bastinii]|jgi:EAL domain-containing protein (putative c-di-GMP-specific phosphodiesterase class I)|uniref:EAL domain-containing protein n=1 Tax=Maridesulfovibrio bastinii TaxID=47157 RepID=UPI00040635D9|nr:EAL domain-containing protein [Maridesulfovibrio bastinii]